LLQDSIKIPTANKAINFKIDFEYFIIIDLN
jgi:hypothetical protein